MVVCYLTNGPKLLPTASATSLPYADYTNSTSGSISANFSSSTKHPPFIRPHVNPSAECNLWGPTCQTGSIVVDVNVKNSITPTTVACSYYLSAQSESAAFDADLDNSLTYSRSFGRSHECTSYKNQGFSISIPNCGSNASGTLMPPSNHLPIGVGAEIQVPAVPIETSSAFGDKIQGQVVEASCCGSCWFQLHRVRLIYFPTVSQSSCVQSHNTVSARNNLLSNSSFLTKLARTLEINAPGVFLSSSWFYYSTSPSIYLEMLGTATVRDHCGTIDRIATGTIVALPADGVSTLSYDLPIESTLTVGHADARQIHFQSYISNTKPLNMEDLACPTWGFASASTFTQKTQASTPFNPVILPPKELLFLDPAWVRCSKFDILYDIFDPPKALTSVTALSPIKSPAQPTRGSTLVTTSSAKPGNTVIPSFPVNTAGPKAAPAESSSSTDPIPHKDEPQSVEPAHASPAAYSSKPPYPVDSASVPSSAALQQDRGRGKSKSIPSVNPAQVPSISVNQVSSGTENGQGIGALMHSLLGGPKSSESSATPTKSDPKIVSTANAPSMDVSAILPSFSTNPIEPSRKSNLSPSQTVDIIPAEPAIALPGTPASTAGGQNFTVGSSGSSVTGITVLAGGPGITVSGTPISLGKSYVVVDSETIDVASVVNPSAPSSFTINGAIFAADPSGLLVDGKKITPGGSAVTVSGTAVSVDPSSRLVLGSSTKTLPSPYQPPFHSTSVLTINGTTFTADPSGLEINNTTIVAGGADIPISGTTYSLEPSGTLRIGTSENSLPTGNVNRPVIFFGAAERKVDVSGILVVWVSVNVGVGS